MFCLGHPFLRVVEEDAVSFDPHAHMLICNRKHITRDGFLHAFFRATDEYLNTFLEKTKDVIFLFILPHELNAGWTDGYFFDPLIGTPFFFCELD